MSEYFAALDRTTIGLTHEFWVSPLSCANNEHYEQFIRYCALQDNIEGKSTTQLFIQEDEKSKAKRILGFVSLRATSLCQEDGNCVLGSPAIEISELAVSKDYERHGVGRLLFSYAISVASHLNEEFVGVKHIVLCSDEKAQGFYRKMNCEDLREYFQLPREGWNKDCAPMALRLL